MWVWNRSRPLSDREIEALRQAGVATLLWQAGEIAHSSGRAIVANRFPVPRGEDSGSLRVIPVVRIRATVGDPAALSASSLSDCLAELGVSRECQIDYDCPGSRLADYADLLGAVRREANLDPLSITALPSWSSHKTWPALQVRVDALFPMFYDNVSEPEQPSNRPSEAIPLIERGTLRHWLRTWNQNTTVPWVAGLPNFTRLSIFRGGATRGHIRSWTQAEVFENPALSFDGTGKPGVFLYRALAPTRIGTTTLEQNDWIVFRRCDRTELREALAQVENSNAGGTAWFQMPRPGLASRGWSLTEIGHDFAGTPELRVDLRPDRFALHNTGTADLAPFPEHLIEISLQGAEPFLREARPGSDFGGIEFRRDGEPVPPDFATEMKLTLPKIRAGEVRELPLFLLRKPEIPLETQWRINEASWSPVASL